MATYLVTGAAGFIASSVCEKLVADGHIVVGVDNLNDYYDPRLKDYRVSRLLGAEWSLADGPIDRSRYLGASRLDCSRNSGGGRFFFEPVDIENKRDLERLFAEFNFEAVFNLAARGGVRYSMENPYIYLSTNTLGTLNVLECMRTFGVKHHVMASTSSLYTGSPMPFSESQPVNTPISPYAATKKAAELMAHSYFALYGINSVILRYFTVFGPAGRPDMSIFRFIRWIHEKRPIQLLGDGSQTRDFTYVDDIVRGTIAAAKLSGYEIINLGGGRTPLTLREVIRIMEEELGTDALIDQKPAHIADAKDTQADISKAARLMGWSPVVSARDGIKSCVRWHMENLGWVVQIRL